MVNTKIHLHHGGQDMSEEYGKQYVASQDAKYC